MTAKHVSRELKRLSASLSRELRGEYRVHTMPIKKGDNVQILRGNFKGVEGTVTQVFSKEAFINVEGATREKADGTVIFAPIHPSKIMITRLNLDDPRRKDILERRARPRRGRG